MPWIAAYAHSDGWTDSFAPLAPLHWQVHLCGAHAAEIAEACSVRGLAFQVPSWLPAARRSGPRRERCTWRGQMATSAWPSAWRIRTPARPSWDIVSTAVASDH